MISSLRTRASSFGDSWMKFWFAPGPLQTMALFRIASGVTTLFASASFVFDVEAMLSRDGVAPKLEMKWTSLSLFGEQPSLTHSYIVLALTIAAALLVIVGWHTRVAAVVAAVSFASIVRRDVWALNSGDLLVQCMAVYLCFMPSARVWSLDARRNRKKGRVPAATALWPLRVVQLQICAVYVGTVVAKAPGEFWLDGTAVSYALRMQDITRIPAFDFVTQNVYLINTLTWATIGFEILFPILIWVNRARRPLLIGGLLLHASIHFVFMVGPFSIAMLTGYVAFLTAAQAAWWYDLPKRATAWYRRHSPDMVDDEGDVALAS